VSELRIGIGGASEFRFQLPLNGRHGSPNGPSEGRPSFSERDPSRTHVIRIVKTNEIPEFFELTQQVVHGLRVIPASAPRSRGSPSLGTRIPEHRKLCLDKVVEPGRGGFREDPSMDRLLRHPQQGANQG